MRFHVGIGGIVNPNDYGASGVVVIPHGEVTVPPAEPNSNGANVQSDALEAGEDYLDDAPSQAGTAQTE
jgi:hypothetical protein